VLLYWIRPQENYVSNDLERDIYRQHYPGHSSLMECLIQAEGMSGRGSETNRVVLLEVDGADSLDNETHGVYTPVFAIVLLKVSSSLKSGPEYGSDGREYYIVLYNRVGIYRFGISLLKCRKRQIHISLSSRNSVLFRSGRKMLPKTTLSLD
jgi:hypothetical protein